MKRLVYFADKQTLQMMFNAVGKEAPKTKLYLFRMFVLHPNRKDLLDFLLQKLEDPDKDKRYLAMSMLYNLSAIEALPGFKRIANDENEPERTRRRAKINIRVLERYKRYKEQNSGQNLKKLN